MTPVKRRVTKRVMQEKPLETPEEIVRSRAGEPNLFSRYRWLFTGVVAVGLLVAIFVGAASFKGFAQPVPTDEAGEIQAVIDRVAELVAIDESEPPAVASVTDADLLRTHSPLFYRDAQNGDRLLVWKSQIVLYSTTLDRVLAVQPVDTIVPSEAETEASKEQPTLLVRNGSGKPGLAADITNRLATEGFQTQEPGNAANAYPTSLIVVAEGKEFPQSIERLQETLGAEVASLPAEEAAADADILILLGADAGE